MGTQLTQQLIRIAQLACLSLFLGRAWQHLVWTAPYRELLWSEGLMKGAVETLTQMSWSEYVTSPKVESIITGMIRTIGAFYLLCAGATLTIRAGRPALGLVRMLLLASSAMMLFLACMYWKENFFRIGMLVEYAGQILSPVVLCLLIAKKVNRSRLVRVLQIAILLTFVGHGLYAIGYYPVPGPFIDMCINVFGVSERNARAVLLVAGVLDLILAVTLFVPRAARITLWYGVVWGAMTALARLVSNYDASLLASSLLQWVPEVLVRAPHALLPLALLLLFRGGADRYVGEQFNK